jgi:hypothetical protein
MDAAVVVVAVEAVPSPTPTLPAWRGEVSATLMRAAARAVDMSSVFMRSSSRFKFKFTEPIRVKET